MKKNKKKTMSRRVFIKTSAALGVTSLLASSIAAKPESSSGSEDKGLKGSVICSVEGSDAYKSTIKAVQELGGMSKFVPQKSRVALLANAQRYNPGTYTHPEILAAVIHMCKDAGAKEINCLTLQSKGNWEKTGLLKAAKEGDANLIFVDSQDETKFKTIPVPKGKALKEAMIMKDFFTNDVFITIPITKDHAGNKFTGTLKNMMGLNASTSNRLFHKKNWRTDLNSITHLDQCIADLNTVLSPNLCIVDATEFITTNGPFGPGELKKARLIIAGTDRVAMDAFSCTLWGLNPEDIIMINKAFEHKLGEIKKYRILTKKI